MIVLSLFDGMSCGQIALERVGIKVEKYYASEIDKYAIKITQKNYPNTIQLGDVTQWHEWNLPKIDLLIGGSPCQGFSNAGSGLNFKDPRSGLFFEFAKILKRYKPTYFLLENVKMKKEWQNVISEYLRVEPIEIDSALVSAQSRKRLYWTNIENIEQPVDKKILLKNIIDSGDVCQDKSYCIDANYYRGGSIKNHGIKPFQLLRESERRMIVNEGEKWRKLTPKECERLQTVPIGYTEGVSNLQRHKMLGNGWTVDVIAHIFSYLNITKIKSNMVV